MSTPLVIAIDGPAGAGKSTVARKVAARLGLTYVDSGATYRAAALKVLQSAISPDDEQGVAKLIAQTAIRIATDGLQSRVLVDGEDVTEKIRTSEVTLAAAKVSRLSEVRAKLVAVQRGFAMGRGLVMEGRDIGTVVFPNAALKVFLRADPEERARRRLKQDTKEGRFGHTRTNCLRNRPPRPTRCREEDFPPGGRAGRLSNRLHLPCCRSSGPADSGFGTGKKPA